MSEDPCPSSDLKGNKWCSPSGTTSTAGSPSTDSSEIHNANQALQFAIRIHVASNDDCLLCQPAGRSVFPVLESEVFDTIGTVPCHRSRHGLVELFGMEGMGNGGSLLYFGVVGDEDKDGGEGGTINECTPWYTQPPRLTMMSLLSVSVAFRHRRKTARCSRSRECVGQCRNGKWTA